MQKLWSTITEHFIPSPNNTYRPYLLRKSWLIFFLTIVLTTEGVFVAGLMSQQLALLQPAAVVPADVITLTNMERVRENTPLLTENPLLDAAAQAKADDMAANGYFAHIGPDGKEPWQWLQENGYNYWYAGENLAVRFDESADVVKAWMASPPHRANIVKGVYTDVGIGVARGTYRGSPATFIVQYFGTPPSAVSAAAPRTQVTFDASGATVEGINVAGAQFSAGDGALASSMSEAQQPLESQPAAHTESLWRQIVGAFSDSSQSTSWILGGVLLLVLFVLALAFFIHIEIQSHEMLIGGAVVASVAALFLVLNMRLPQVDGQSQSAAVVQLQPTILVGDDAAAIEAPTTSSEVIDQQTLPIEVSE